MSAIFSLKSASKRPAMLVSVLPTIGAFALMLMLLTACGGRAIDGKAVTELNDAAAQPPAALTAPCEPATDIPTGPLNAGPAERLWERDRASLQVCGARHSAVVDFYKRRDAGLAGKSVAP